MTRKSEGYSDPILRTQLHRPPVTADLVHRNRLHDQMDVGLRTSISAVSAPAGYGKSVLVSMGSQDALRESTVLIEEVLQAVTAINNTFHRIDLLVLQALALQTQGHEGEALDVLRKAVSLAAPRGVVPPCVEPGSGVTDLLGQLEPRPDETTFVHHILGSVGRRRAAIASEAPALRPAQAKNGRREPAADALTHRELDILELVAKRYQNKEIADRLSISTHTANDHLQHIYQKLHVTRRRQAVDRAVEMGILNPRASG